MMADLENRGFTRYNESDTIEPGDLLIHDSEIANQGVYPFSTCVVLKVEANGQVRLARPMARADSTGSCWTYIEHFDLSQDGVRKRFLRYTTGNSGRPYNVCFPKP